MSDQIKCPTNPLHMSVRDIEHAVERRGASPEIAVAVIRERIAQLQELANAWQTYAAASQKEAA